MLSVVNSVPRASGDKPNEDALALVAAQCSPRQRGQIPLLAGVMADCVSVLQNAVFVLILLVRHDANNFLSSIRYP
ncbi:hypothetical protein [Pectobacterium polonicum]|uniref:hypothetical protein n=1 Tax=Pectobacterium polonicum TaxID=2485124 RepID=UPI0039F72214